jgi:Ca2+-binding EF-hand superfamily protein
VQFVLFAAFAYFDSTREGRLTVPGMRAALEMLGMPVPDADLCAMLRLGAHDDSLQVGALRFLAVLGDVEFIKQ